MRKASQSDKKKVVEILTESFIDNKSVNYILKKGGNKERKIKDLMNYSFNLGMKKGDIFINEENNACSIIMYPKKKKYDFWSLIQDIKLVKNVIGLKKVIKVSKKEKEVSNHHPENNFAHLWYIGVEKKSQGRGLGTDFLNKICTYYKEKDLKIYLETSTEINIPFYKKSDFGVFNINEEYGFKFYHLKN